MIKFEKFCILNYENSTYKLVASVLTVCILDGPLPEPKTKTGLLETKKLLFLSDTLNAAKAANLKCRPKNAAKSCHS